MPDSQRQRPGAKLVASREKKQRNAKNTIDGDAQRQKQFARIADLEEQLTNLGSSNDDRACKCRAHLCEILSEILVANPKCALETDCFARLWKNCFYNPINVWRSRVSREKRKQLQSLKQTVAGYKSFISESVTLYDYFVHQYLSKLVPASSQDQLASSSQQSSQDSFTQDSSLGSTTTVQSAQESLEGVVPGLYRLYIYLGDLHRYDEAYNKAELNYMNAAKLGPGRGNPYNQLAVVAFTKEAHCVALYWYARSLLATHEKFATSSSNLVRLFSTNRDYLRDHGRDSKPTVLVQDFSRKSSNDSTMARAQKAAACKSCLAHFVDFHYDLYQQNDTLISREDAAALRGKMVAIVISLDSLLQVSGFSDGLLSKIVVVTTFSLERAKEESQNDVCRRLSMEFLFLLGSTISERVQGLLSKTLEKASPSKPAPAIRLLLPLEILVEFVETAIESSNSAVECDATTQMDFWSHIVQVGSLVRKIVDGYKLERNSAILTQDSRRPYVLKEYELLKGYRPFPVMSQEFTSEDGFLDPHSAVDALELSPSSQSQETGTSTGGNSVEENRAKLLRMLDICKRLASPSSNVPIAFDMDGTGAQIFRHTFGCKNNEDKQMTDFGVSDQEPQDDGIVSIPSFDDNQDDAGDVVLFQVPVNGSGPALLVPGAICTSKATPEHNSNSEATVVGVARCESRNATNKNGAEVVDFADPSRQSPVASGADSDSTVVDVPAQPVIKPPPGFAAPVLVAPPINGSIPLLLVPPTDQTTPNMESFEPVAYTNSILGQVIQGRVAAQLPTMFDIPQYHESLPPPNLAHAVYTFGAGAGDHLFGSKPDGYGRITAGESVELFGDPTSFQTANPFATHSFNVSTANNQNLSSLHESGTAAEGIQFLGDAFLNSLMMDEGKTNNPWAAK